MPRNLSKQCSRTRSIGHNLYVTAASLTKSGTLAAMNKAATEFGVLEAQETFQFEDAHGVGYNRHLLDGEFLCQVRLVQRGRLHPKLEHMDFGEAGAGTERTLTLTAQQPMTVTRIAAPAFEDCAIVPKADCIDKELRPGDTCTIRVDVFGQASSIPSSESTQRPYTEIPYPVGILANSDAPGACKVHPTEDEAVNMTFMEGAWAPSTAQSNKIVVHNGGQVEGYLGNGTATVKNANARQFDLQFNNYSSYTFTATLDDLNSNLTITYSPKSNPAVVYGLNTFVRRPWDSRCNAGQTFFAGFCYDVPATHEPTAPGFIGKPCPPDWRDDGTSCYPAWTGKVVPAQADPEGSFTIRHPIIVTDCFQYATAPAKRVRRTSRIPADRQAVLRSSTHFERSQEYDRYHPNSVSRFRTVVFGARAIWALFVFWTPTRNYNARDTILGMSSSSKNGLDDTGPGSRV